MVTARSPIGVLRTRASRGPLHLLWLTLLLIGLVYTHGVSMESASHHLANGGSAFAATSGHVPAHPANSPLGTGHSLQGTDEEHEGEGSSHPAEECMPGQPQQGTALQAPCFGVLGDSAVGGQATGPSVVTNNKARDLPLSGAARTTGVLRI